MPRMLRRAAVLGTTAHVAAKRGEARAMAAQPPAPESAPPPPEQAAAVVPEQAAPPEAEAPESSVDPYGDLMKLKQLLDAGVLTQDEFDAQKQKVLGS